MRSAYGGLDGAKWPSERRGTVQSRQTPSYAKDSSGSVMFKQSSSYDQAGCCVKFRLYMEKSIDIRPFPMVYQFY